MPEKGGTALHGSTLVSGCRWDFANIAACSIETIKNFRKKPKVCFLCLHDDLRLARHEYTSKDQILWTTKISEKVAFPEGPNWFGPVAASTLVTTTITFRKAFVIKRLNCCGHNPILRFSLSSALLNPLELALCMVPIWAFPSREIHHIDWKSRK